MRLEPLDWFIVIASITISFIPAILLARRAGSSTAEFFTSGRSAPWWLIGVSMVATTFSTDTPNLVTDFVRSKGVSYNWAWWSFLLTGMLTVFFYARLWRRSGVLTDLEFYELRYSGRSAATGVATGLDLGLRKRDDNFALRFTGYVEVPADGVYTFYLNSDDGSRLLIGSEVVVDNNGLHAAVDVPGQALLKAGQHPITVEYFQAGGERRLDVGYEGPGLAHQPLPPAALSHRGT